MSLTPAHPLPSLISPGGHPRVMMSQVLISPFLNKTMAKRIFVPPGFTRSSSSALGSRGSSEPEGQLTLAVLQTKRSLKRRATAFKPAAGK